jgi:aminopeptidase N
MASLLLVMALSGAIAGESPGPGISEALARERAAVISDLRYDLTFTIPDDRSEPVRGHAIVRFVLAAPHRVVLDFAQPSDRVRRVRIDGRDVDLQVADGHLMVPADRTRAGGNAIELEFIAGNDALNRSDEFLHTLFVPARAHLAFPCFDQPDLKGRYTLTLEVPTGWQAVGNGAETGRESRESSMRVRFEETPPLPTYLFSFVAGRFFTETATRSGRDFRMFHRETDATKVARNRDAIFDLHASALEWLEGYTGIPYPFSKFDFVLIPSFQFGGMEHPGAILYNVDRLLLEASATQNQFLERASLIAHETAHMWFGDLVTMRWFSDVWMKEVFANFMAAKIVNPSFPEVNHELRFLLAHHPAAYQVDRTPGANPIRQPLENLHDAGQLYGPIIYQKAPIMMRQLELMVGETAFREAIRAYLKRYAFANASWLDLVRLLDARSREDVASWSRAWVEQRGRPIVATEIRLDARGQMSGLTLTMNDPLGRNLVWPQRLRVAIGYPGTVRELSVHVTGRTTRVRGVAGWDRPLYVLPAAGGLGYGLFVLDDASRQYLLGQIEEIPDALTRGSAWVTLWENMLEGHVAAPEFVRAALRALPEESDEQNAQRLLAYTVRAFWRLLSPDERAAAGRSLESTLRAGIQRAATQSQKGAWFNAFRDSVQSSDGVGWLTRLWRRDEHIPGLTFAETDEIAMALELAVRGVPEWESILRLQHDRIQNPDRKQQFAFVMPALSADPAVREAAFERFRAVEHRQRETWVLQSLHYLNHPLREEHARRFILPALELLREIQQTGDIFFPTRWMEATLWGHRSPEAVNIVQMFLAGNPDYPQRLRWTVFSTADELVRAAAR